MVDGFRYASSWDEFERVVWELNDLLKRKDAYWAVGFMGKFDLFIDDAMADGMKENVLDIIYDEILYLLKWRLDENIMGEEDIRAVLFATDNGISEEELEEMAKIVCNKYELIMDVFDIEYLAMRYNWKRDTLSPKLANLRYDVSTQYIPDGHKINCVLVNMECRKKWNGCDQQSEDITFICDEEDIDLWISQLKEMQQRIRECQNGDYAE